MTARREVAAIAGGGGIDAVGAGDRVVATIAAGRILPVIVTDDPSAAHPLADALVAGGVSLAEITFRTPAAAEALRAFADRPDLTVGAGTVVTVEQVDLALAAGAQFVVSPGLDREVVEQCQQHGVPVFPGVATATETMAAIHCGLDVVKLFPAGQLGGPAVVAALAAPFPGLRFIPTGGINESNLASYLAQSSVLAVGGSWMATRAMIERGAWSDITAATARAVALAWANARG